MNRITAAGDYLMGLRRGRRRVPQLPAEIAPRTLEEAYQVQNAFVGRLLACYGGRLCGYKIACTSRIAQETLGVDTPLFGRLLTATSYPSGTTLSANDFLVRCAEVEFGFLIGQDMPTDRRYTVESVRPFIAAVVPALEIVDHRFEDWQQVGAPTLAADNAIHGAWIYGAPLTDWQQYDLARQATALVVNGQQRFTGIGAAVLGHPLAALAWLANELPRHGLFLRQGDFVSTGLTTAIYLAQPGDHLQGDFGPLGQVEVRFTPA
ncbi:MAG: fumarylacetoacetate hydrolase family protein [Gemmataceae bacterium]|nr:fumarylacetoacetate hydrolase family protein [Gemmataceae bacterium]